MSDPHPSNSSDVGQADFADLVLQQSHTRPVVADFWAASIRDGRYVPASAISPALARDMLQRGLVRQDDLDRVGVRP